MAFTDTENKQVIRLFDKEIIQQFSNNKGNKLSYFGLPGPEMLDVLEWKDHLGDIVGVIDDQNDMEKMVFTAFKNHLTKNFTAIYSDIDELILRNNNNNKCKFPLDLINLDYSGGITKDSIGESKRISAWDRLLSIQSRHKIDFLLLITLNPREDTKGELNLVIDEIGSEIKRLIDLDVSPAIEWFKKSKEYHKLIVYIPYIIGAKASHYRYNIKCYPPIIYIGSSSRPLTHFTFEFNFCHGRMTHTLPAQTLSDIICSNVKECIDGQIRECKIEGINIARSIITKNNDILNKS